MMEAAAQGAGVALAPPLMFPRLLGTGAIVQPFPISISTGSYWLTRLQSKNPSRAMQTFAHWLQQASRNSAESFTLAPSASSPWRAPGRRR